MGGKGGGGSSGLDYSTITAMQRQELQTQQASQAAIAASNQNSEANIKIAQMQSQTSQDQLSWAKEQYADQSGLSHQYIDAMLADQQEQSSLAERQAATAAQDRARYEQTYQPLEDKLVGEANTWDSPARADQQAGQAMADVSSTFNQNRTAALSNLESYGIDPSQTRFGALDLGTRIQQAAATAAAGTMSRQQTQATGLALQSEAINIGRGYPGQVAQSYATANQSYAGAAQSGQSGINAGLNTSNTYGNLMGTAAQWGGLATGSYGASDQALGTGISAINAGTSGMSALTGAALGSGQLANQNAQLAAQKQAGIGSMVGGAVGIAASVAVAL